MLLKFAIVLNLILVIDCQTVEEMELKPHKVYKDLNCYYPKITSMTKLRDNKYFISTDGQKFWLISDSEEATNKNSRDLKTITTEWQKIDASIYMGLNVECGLEFRDKLILINYNLKTNQNEIIVGSLADWKWTPMSWSDFKAFYVSSIKSNITGRRIDWTKRIDGMAIIDESLYIFQDQTQIQIFCSLWYPYTYREDYTFREVPVSGPIDAAYCEDRHKDTIPLYIIRRNSYFICYVNEDNRVFPTCEQFPSSENTMSPIPECFVASDPNERLMSSLFVQMIILFILLVALIIFSAIFLWNLWLDTSKDTFIRNEGIVSAKKKKKNEKISESKPKDNKQLEENKKKPEKDTQTKK